MSFSSSLTELGLMYMKRRGTQNIETERQWDAHVDKALPSLFGLHLENCEKNKKVRDYYCGNSED